MDIRPYDESRDLEAIQRIWYEVGWVDSAEQAACIGPFLKPGTCLTAHLNGAAECAVHNVPGSVLHGQDSLPMTMVTAVTTSRIARKQGFAQRLTALQLATAVEQGAQVAMLGMFDQGFYDRLGFGNGAYEHQFTFDPATLDVDVGFRVPSRLVPDQWREMHKALVSRLRSHGGVNLDPPEMIQAEVGFTSKGYGLGYYEGGELTHFFWFDVRGQHGPYVVTALAYRTPDQLLELLALLKSLADQVTSVTMMEPPHVQLQSLLKQPFRTRRLTRRSEHGNEHKSMAWWQIRLLDLAVLARYCWRGEPVRFNLELVDPIEMQLSDQPAGSWRGIAGSYQVELATSSAVVAGVDPELPTLRASVNALSRLYFGAARASVLAVGKDFSAPAPLIARLNEVFCMPQPSTGWDF